MINTVRHINGETRVIGLLDGEPVSDARVQFMERLRRQRLSNPTEGELALWGLCGELRNELLTKRQAKWLRYRREVPIHFSNIKARLADMVIRACHDRIIVEVDGRIHEGRKHLDEWNDEMLLRVGNNKVLRFTNEEVLARKEWVLFQICGTLARECDVRQDTREGLWKAVEGLKDRAMMPEVCSNKF